MKNYLELFPNDSIISPEHNMKLKDTEGEIIGEKPKTKELMLSEDIKTLVSNIRNIFILNHELEKSIPKICENKSNIVAPNPKYSFDRFRKREVVPGLPVGFILNSLKSDTGI